jgi:hypothetical protein
MAEEKIELVIGDWSNDGHGRTDSIPLIIKVENGDDVVKALENAENVLLEQYNIDLTLWFAEYEDNKINKDDVEKLVKLDVEFDKNQIDENGDLTIWLADEFYEIWKQLIVKANPNISIKRIKLKPFCSKCSGYGIYV